MFKIETSELGLTFWQAQYVGTVEFVTALSDWFNNSPQGFVNTVAALKACGYDLKRITPTNKDQPITPVPTRKRGK